MQQMVEEVKDEIIKAKKSRAYHSARLLLFGSVSVILGALITATVILIRYPTYEQNCTRWSPTSDFPPLPVPGPSGLSWNMKAVEAFPNDNKCAEIFPLFPGSEDPAQKVLRKTVLHDGSLRMSCCQQVSYVRVFPGSISESIRNWEAPEGRIFFGFMLIGALCIFFSFHPYYLSNVAPVGDLVFGLFPTAHFRQYCPATGLLLMATVPTVSFEHIAGFHSWTELVTNLIMYATHVFGFVGAYVGYLIAEQQAIFPRGEENWEPFQRLFYANIHSTVEERLRRTSFGILSVSLGGYAICVWITIMAHALMKNQSFWTSVAWSWLSFMCQVTATSAICANLLIIHHFAPERTVKQDMKRLVDPTEDDFQSAENLHQA